MDKELQTVLIDENIDYSKSYRIKIEDLRYIYKRKSNFWLIINWVDTVTSGIVVAYLITWITIEVGLSFEAESVVIAVIYVGIIAVGVLFLLKVNIWYVFAHFWPVILIIWGAYKLYYGLKERREEPETEIVQE